MHLLPSLICMANFGGHSSMLSKVKGETGCRADLRPTGIPPACGHSDSCLISVASQHLFFMHHSQMRVPTWRQIRRLDQHGLQVFVALFRELSATWRFPFSQLIHPNIPFFKAICLAFTKARSRQASPWRRQTTHPCPLRFSPPRKTAPWVRCPRAGSSASCYLPESFLCRQWR